MHPPGIDGSGRLKAESSQVQLPSGRVQSPECLKVSSCLTNVAQCPQIFVASEAISSGLVAAGLMAGGKFCVKMLSLPQY